jgi:hypothetical protein
MTLARAAALCALLLAPASAGCASELDCTYNGLCLPSGACLCDAGWGGPACAALKLTVTDPALGHPWGAPGSSWGGLPVFDPVGGAWHLYYSQMVGGCGLGSWGTNSRVVHAQGSSPLGPFVDVDVVQPAFAHNAQAFRTPQGTWVVWHIGCAQGERVVNCSGGAPSPELPLAARTVPPGAPGSNPSPLCAPQPLGALGEFYMSYLWAPSPAGPWTPLGRPALAGSFNRSTWWPFLTNPAPWLQRDGSLLLAVSGDGGVSGKCIGFAVAPTWNGTLEVVAAAAGQGDGAPIPNGEDPFVWVNSRGHRHALWHDTSGRSNGGHAFAPAAAPNHWTVASRALYTGELLFPNGTTGVANDRERPKLLLDEAGVPLGLFNGLIPPGVGNDGGCFTAVTRIEL